MCTRTADGSQSRTSPFHAVSAYQQTLDPEGCTAHSRRESTGGETWPNPSGAPTDNCAKDGQVPWVLSGHSRFEIGTTKSPARNLRAGQVLSRCCNSRSIVLSRNGAQEAPLGTVSTGWYGTTATEFVCDARWLGAGRGHHANADALALHSLRKRAKVAVPGTPQLSSPSLCCGVKN